MVKHGWPAKGDLQEIQTGLGANEKGAAARKPESMLKKIISGGQTGADQGALDAAIALAFPHGGYGVKDRKTEASPLTAMYSQLQEAFSKGYPERTEQNLIDSDGTLIPLS